MASKDPLFSGQITTDEFINRGNSTIGNADSDLATFKGGVKQTPQSVTPDAVSGDPILPGITQAVVGAVTNDANDWIVLPALASTPNGHEITVLLPLLPIALYFY